MEGLLICLETHRVQYTRSYSDCPLYPCPHMCCLFVYLFVYPCPSVSCVACLVCYFPFWIVSVVDRQQADTKSDCTCCLRRGLGRRLRSSLLLNSSPRCDLPCKIPYLMF